MSQSGHLDSNKKMPSEATHSKATPSEATPTKKKSFLNLRLIGLITGVVLVFVIISVICAVIFSQKDKRSSTSWYNEGSCSQKCSKENYSKAPLLLISFDGFRGDYLDRGWAPWFSKFAKCGVRAEKVYSVYPSKTFVNHYSQVTGLYPTYHGLVDNVFWDKEINPKGKESMPKTKNPAYYKGIPIWEHYMKIGGRVNCFFWVGSEMRKCTEYKIYHKDQGTSFEDRIAVVRNWLNLPEEKRPGLLTLYFDEPDSIGHKTGGNILKNKMVKKMVKRMDELFHNFLQGLHEDGILNCVNIVVLSDHGMTGINDFIDISSLISNSTEMSTGGPLARIYMENAEDFVKKQGESCTENKKKFLITTDRNRPVRQHHSGKKTIGDVLLEGKLGTAFVEKGQQLTKGNHGYDYLHPEMGAIFMGRGPGFKPGVTFPPVQTHEFFNLWLDLLGMDPINYPSNATVGLFDSILTTPLSRQIQEVPTLPTCSVSSTISPCCQQNSLCGKDDYLPDMIGSVLPFCKEEQVCGKRMLTLDGRISGIIEVKNEKMLQSTCSCGGFSGFDNFLVNLPLKIEGTFIPKALDAMDKLQINLLQNNSKIYVLSGIAADKNYDGIADVDQRQSSHFYRLIIFCEGSNYQEKEKICGDKTALKTKGFIFPLIDSDPNCLESKELLEYYSATVKDIEAITGLRLKLAGFSLSEIASIRAAIK